MLTKFMTGTLIMLVQIRPPITLAWSHSEALSHRYEVTVLGAHSWTGLCPLYTVADALSARSCSAGLKYRLFLSRTAVKVYE